MFSDNKFISLVKQIQDVTNNRQIVWGRYSNGNSNAISHSATTKLEDGSKVYINVVLDTYSTRTKDGKKYECISLSFIDFKSENTIYEEVRCQEPFDGDLTEYNVLRNLFDSAMKNYQQSVEYNQPILA